MSGQTSGLNPEKVKAIIDELRIAHDEVTKITIDKPQGAMLGDNPHGVALLSDIEHATKSLDLWLSYQSKSLIQFGRALEDAMKAIQNADDDSEASARVIQDAVEGVTAKFSELTGKDTRPQAVIPTNLPGPFGALGQVMQTLQSEAEFDTGVNK